MGVPANSRIHISLMHRSGIIADSVVLDGQCAVRLGLHKTRVAGGYAVPTSAGSDDAWAVGSTYKVAG